MMVIPEKSSRPAEKSVRERERRERERNVSEPQEIDLEPHWRAVLDAATD